MSIWLIYKVVYDLEVMKYFSPKNHTRKIDKIYKYFEL